MAINAFFSIELIQKAKEAVEEKKREDLKMLKEQMEEAFKVCWLRSNLKFSLRHRVSLACNDNYKKSFTEYV